jgi:hypothetical protein
MLTLEDNKNPIKTTENQNQLSERNQSIETVPPNRGLSERLMYTKIVRIHPGTTCACVKNCNKLIFYINTINRIDNQEPSNEKETPLFYVEEELPCSFCCFGECTFYIKFNIFDAITKELFSESSINTLDSVIDNCCGDNYIVYAPINNTKLNTAGISTINRHDSRSLYRTYEISEQSYYKIGEPYVEIEPPCCECSLYCFCSYMPIIGCLMSCCECKLGCCTCPDLIEDDDKRHYIYIFNMNDQPVGKFAFLHEKPTCCKKGRYFYEIYFPPDANEMIRLALIGQILFFSKFKDICMNAFASYPGRRDNIEQFMS